MPQFLTGNMFANPDKDTILIATTNASVNKQNELVMGKGAALQLQKLAPGIALKFGEVILKNHFAYPAIKCDTKNITAPAYHLILIDRFGAFQVKFAWWEEAKLDLIQESAIVLAMAANKNPNIKYRLNFPGIGAGKLKKEYVLPYLEILPDNISVWEYK